MKFKCSYKKNYFDIKLFILSYKLNIRNIIINFLLIIWLFLLQICIFPWLNIDLEGYVWIII